MRGVAIIDSCYSLLVITDVSVESIDGLRYPSIIAKHATLIKICLCLTCAKVLQLVAFPAGNSDFLRIW